MRLLLAVWAAKLSAVAGVILGKKSSSGPGSIALRICPDLIKRLVKSVKYDVIATCGTNGKTTTNNMIYTALSNCGYRVVCNRLGANMLSGTATAFALACNWLGRLKADYACLEVDEAYTLKVFEHISPDYVVITNLFRDQLDRYGEIESTAKIIKSALENSNYPTLVLNGDDPISANFGRDYKGAVKYIGVSQEVMKGNDAKDGKFCTICGEELLYNYTHYSQLGDYYCPKCGNKRPKIDYDVTNVDLSRGLSFDINGKNTFFDYKGFYNIYNIASVIALMDILGKGAEDPRKILSGHQHQIGRMQSFDLGKPFILNLAKNPAGFNQAIQTVVADPRKKDIIIAVNDCPSDGTDVSWLWDVNFDAVNDGTLNHLGLVGDRRYDLALRFKYDDVPVNIVTEDMKSLITSDMLSPAEVCYVLVNYTNLFPTEKILNELLKEREKNNG